MHRVLVLLAVGFQASRRGGAGAVVHRIALLIAAAVAVLTCWLLVSISVVSQQQTERVAAREPVFTTADDPAAAARWIIHADFVDDRQFLVLYVAPLRDDVPPPPGLPRWPRPGEVFLSPQVLATSDPAAVKHRYGRFVGPIGSEGLAHARERLAYYRPASDDAFDQRSGPVAVAGFGVDAHLIPDEVFPRTIDGAGTWSSSDMYLLALFVIVLPAGVLLVLAVRTNAERRDRRLAMLDALGAPARARAWVLVGEAAPPAAAGAAIAALGAYLASGADLPVPLTGYLARADDLAGTRAALVPLAAGVFAAVLALVVVAQLRTRASGETRPRRVRQRFRGWAQASFPLAMALTFWGATTARGEPSTGGYSIGLIAFLGGAIAVLATLPAVLGTVAAAAGRAIAALGTRTSSPAAIIAGRWLTQRPALVARLCAAFVIGLGLLVQVQVQQDWIIMQTQGRANGITPAAVSIGDQLVTVRTTATAHGAREFTHQVGSDSVLRAIDTADGPMLTGTCAALGRLGSLTECPSQPTGISVAYHQLGPLGQIIDHGSLISTPGAQITTDADHPGDTTGFFIINTHGSAGVETIHQAAYTHLTKPYVATPGQHWIAGGLAGAAVFDWVLAFGAIGLILLTATGALAAAGMFLNHVRSLGVLGTYRATTRFYLGIATWNLGIPLTLAGIVGAAVAAYLGALTLHIRRVGSLNPHILAFGLITVTILAILLTTLCAIAATRGVRNWRPTAD